MTTKVSLNDLMHKATAGQSTGSRHFSPSLFYQLLNDPFGVWCDYHAPKEDAVEKIDRYGKMRMLRGLEYERQWIESQYPYDVRVEPQFGEAALKRTLDLMANGEEAIAAPRLWLLSDDIASRGNLIVRDNSKPSDLGPYHYKVKEIKMSSALQDYHALQAALYNRILGKIQGFTPETADVILNPNSAFEQPLYRENTHTEKCGISGSAGEGNPGRSPSELPSRLRRFRVPQLCLRGLRGRFRNCGIWVYSPKIVLTVSSWRKRSMWRNLREPARTPAMKARIISTGSVALEEERTKGTLDFKTWGRPISWAKPPKSASSPCAF
ncbi:MAG: hypothetical protein HY547_09665 [Elusimicrobia bacterium]|nr:hypothetical protein [Elusimicrobiota bacterium]